MQPFASCYPGYSISSVASANIHPPVHGFHPPLQTSEHHSDKFANKTYGEVLKMYRTESSLKRPGCSELLSDSPKSASHHYKQTLPLAKKATVQTSSDSDKSSANHGMVY